MWLPLFKQTDPPTSVYGFVKSWAPTEVVVTREIPPGVSPSDANTVVAVSSDGTPGSGVATFRENVRVAVFGGTADRVRDLVLEIEARLLAHEATNGFHITPGAGLIVARDKELKCWVAAITVVCHATKKEIL